MQGAKYAVCERLMRLRGLGRKSRRPRHQLRTGKAEVGARVIESECTNFLDGLCEGAESAHRAIHIRYDNRGFNPMTV